MGRYGSHVLNPEWLGVDKDGNILSEEYSSKMRGELVPPIQADGLVPRILPWVVIH